MTNASGRWSRQADQFDWFSVYLRDRGLQQQWRVATVVFTLCLAALPVVLLGSGNGPATPLSTAIAVAASVAGTGAALLWLLGWPTRRQSVIYNVVCCACIAATCLVQSSAYGGLMGCAVFAVIGGFLAYFHAFALVVANFVVAMSTAAVTATRLVIDSGDVALTVSAGLIVVALNVGVPFGIFSLVHSLRTDLRNSDRDPLTGLHNRRSFYNTIGELLLARPAASGLRLNVTMVDLDEFKSLNDTHGHAAGDQALIGVADVLQRSCSPEAVLARLGGEEFVVADVAAAADHAATADRIRSGIAALPSNITASLGICSATTRPGVQVTHPEFIDRLIRVADAAMYRSKRAGGDRIEHTHLDQARPY